MEHCAHALLEVVDCYLAFDTRHHVLESIPGHQVCKSSIEVYQVSRDSHLSLLAFYSESQQLFPSTPVQFLECWGRRYDPTWCRSLPHCWGLEVPELQSLLSLPWCQEHLELQSLHHDHLVHLCPSGAQCREEIPHCYHLFPLYVLRHFWQRVLLVKNVFVNQTTNMTFFLTGFLRCSCIVEYYQCGQR